jgi:hypothetical protein
VQNDPKTPFLSSEIFQDLSHHVCQCFIPQLHDYPHFLIDDEDMIVSKYRIKCTTPLGKRISVQHDISTCKLLMRFVFDKSDDHAGKVLADDFKRDV